MTSRSRLFHLLMALCFAACASTPKESKSPEFPLQPELARWDVAPVGLAGSATQKGAPEAPIGTRVNFSLAQSSAAPDCFIGFAKVTPPANGKFKVLLSQGVWVDLIEPGSTSALKPLAHEKGIAGSSVRKVIEYQLEGRKSYLFQVKGSDLTSVSFLIIPLPVLIQ